MRLPIRPTLSCLLNLALALSVVSCSTWPFGKKKVANPVPATSAPLATDLGPVGEPTLPDISPAYNLQPLFSNDTTLPERQSQPSFAGLARWEGRYPEGATGYGKIWNDPVFKAAFVAAVGPRVAEEVSHGWGAGASIGERIVREGGALHFYVMKPHDALNENMHVFIHLDEGTISACQTTTTKRRVISTIWYETDRKPLQLGKDACRAYDDYI